MAMIAMTSFAAEQNDTTYVTMDFNLNPWNYPVREITKGWSPDYKDWDAPGAFLSDTDFSWPVSEGSAEVQTLVCRNRFILVEADDVMGVHSSRIFVP